MQKKVSSLYRAKTKVIKVEKKKQRPNRDRRENIQICTQSNKHIIYQEKDMGNLR